MIDLRTEYDWTSPGEVDRAWTPSPSQDSNDLRSPFDRDRDRIIHSVAFRRLQGKTQIFAPGDADFLRSRITHSIEVAQIGRDMAKRFGVPESLVEAACLGHDLGHPPFGHTGEEVLNELMTSHGAFEGNAQTFRIVTRLEEKSADFRGLDLCRATLLGLIKYPYRRTRKNTKFLYDDDVDVYEKWLYRNTGHKLAKRHTNHPSRTLPCQLMDWADDIAYSVHDLEDGIVSGLLQPATWSSPWFMEAVWRNTVQAPIRWRHGSPSQQKVEEVIQNLCDRLRYSRGAIPPDKLRDVTRHYINQFAVAPTLVITGSGTSLFDFHLEIPEHIRIENQVLKSITFEFVINDERTRRAAFRGKEILRRLFEALFENACSTHSDKLLLFPRRMRDRLATLDAHDSARVTCDYLASMTEGQALHLYARLFEPSADGEVGVV